MISNDAGSLDAVDFFGFSLSFFLVFRQVQRFLKQVKRVWHSRALSEIFSHMSPASKWDDRRV